jgi:CBS domain-containing protein
MNEDVITAPPTASVSDLARLLFLRGVSAVPICDGDGKLLGMVSEGDLLKPFTAKTDLRRQWWLGVLAEGEEPHGDFLDYLRRDNRRARDLMTSPVVTVGPDATGPEMAELMHCKAIKRVPVLDGGRIVGIVSRGDLVRAMARSPTAMMEAP